MSKLIYESKTIEEIAFLINTLELGNKCNFDNATKLVKIVKLLNDFKPQESEVTNE